MHQKNQNSPKKFSQKKKNRWEKALAWHQCFDKGEINTVSKKTKSS